MRHIYAKTGLIPPVETRQLWKEALQGMRARVQPDSSHASATWRLLYG